MISIFFSPAAAATGCPGRGEDVGHGAFAREQVRHLSLYHGGPQGQVAAGDALGHRHHVRHHVPMLYSEPPASPAKPAYDLVVDQQHPVLVADVADHRPVLVAGHRRARRDRNGLADESQHRLRPVEQDQVLHGPRAPLRAIRGRRAPQRAAVRVGLRRVDHARIGGLEVLPLVYRGAAQPQHAPGRAVVGAFAADNLVPGRLAISVRVGPGNLQRRLVRLRAAADREDARQRARR